MNIQPINPNNPNFKYKHPLKTMYKKGKLPFIEKGFYGEDLTPENCTIEHLKLHSKGGKTIWDNIVLTSADKNMERADKPLSSFIDWKTAGEYLAQFQKKVIPNFGRGEKYIKGILRTLDWLMKNDQ